MRATDEKLTWREMTICRILALIAMMLADEDELRKEIRNVSNHLTSGW